MIYLGAETPKYLKLNLLIGLDDSFKPIVGQINDYKVSGVVALAEAHHVLYVAQDEVDKVLFWQADGGEIICVFRLSPEQCQEWRRQIESIRL